MHPIDRTHGRGLAAYRLPLDSGIYPPERSDLPEGQQSEELAEIIRIGAAAIPYELISTPAVGLGDARRLRLAEAIVPAVVARVRAAVVDEILADLKPAIDWQHEAYGNSKDPADKSAIGRLVGMQDAYRTVAKHRAAPTERSVGSPTPEVGTPGVRDA